MIGNRLGSLIICLLTFSLVQAKETQDTPGVDYPNFVTIPDSSFKCSEQEFIPGFYADLETQCQAYHYCSEEGQETFLCPIGSIFNQEKLACDLWHNSNCTFASELYSSNSGFLLESAMKSIPLLIKLRNRAQKRLSRVPSNVHEKITSLYDGVELDKFSTDSPNVFNDVKAEQTNPDTNEDTQEEQLNQDESLDDILARLEESIQNDEPGDGIYEDNDNEGGDETSENMHTNLFFDPVTENYYMDSESSLNERSQNFDDDQFGFYDHENFAYKYGLAMQDAEESKDFVESNEPIDLYGLNEMNNEEAGDDQLSEGQTDTQSFRRIRRKPIYTVNREDDEFPIGLNDDMDSVMDSEDFSTESVSVVTGASSRPTVEITTEAERVAYTRAPFEMVEDLSRMHMTPLNITEVPMTSEEFEDAIISELIVPKLDEHDLRVLGSTWDQEQTSEGYGDASVQNDGYFKYVENENPERFVYSNVYNVGSDSNVEQESEMSEEMDDTGHYYQNDEMAEDSGKSADTFVVIPDESEISEFSEVFDTSAGSAGSEFQDLSNQNANENDAIRDSMDFNIPTNYESEGVYSDADPFEYRTPRYSSEYSPEQYFPGRYFSPEIEESSSPYDYADESYIADDAESIGSELHHYGLEDFDPANQYAYVSSAMDACQQQIGYGNCMYGPQSRYSFAGYYDNPYVSFPYGASNVESSESSISDIHESYSSESPLSYRIQSDPKMNNEQFDINPDYEHPNPYHNLNLDESEESPEDLGDQILGNESVDKETYYILDDDKTTTEVYSGSVSEPSSLDIDSAVSDVTRNQDETYYILDDEDEENVMKDGAEVENFSNVSENEEVHKQETSSQDKFPRLEPSTEDSVSGKQSQTANSKDELHSKEESALGDDTESVFDSEMDSIFTHVTNGESFITENVHRNGEVLISDEQLSRNDETPKVLVSSHVNLPNMFLNNMAFSDPINFGPHGFGSSLVQPKTGGSPTAFSFPNGQKRTGNPASPDVSKLSALQEKIRSLKQGKFGAFKKYVSSSGSKN